MDDKAWPSLNEAVSEELKSDSVISNVNTKGDAVSHEVVKISDSSEAVCYTVFLFFSLDVVSNSIYHFDDYLLKHIFITQY